MFRFYVCADLIDLNDDGEEQVSIYRTWIDSKKALTPAQAIEIAEEEGDWKIDFGQGDWERLDTYVIQSVNTETNECLLQVEVKA